MPDTYLAHHGIWGMKWGIRRYQNKDGSLTPAGRRRYAKVNSSYLAKISDKSRAKWIVKKEAHGASFLSELHNKSAARAEKKGDLEKAKKYLEAGQEALYKKLSDISDNTLKAGRDYIVQRDLNVYPLLPFAFIWSTEYRLIERNPQKA